MSQQFNLFDMLMSEEERAAMKAAEEKKEEEKKVEEEKKKKKSSTKKKSSGNSKSAGGTASVAEEIEFGEEGIPIITGYYPEKTLLPSDFEKELEEGETVKLSASEVIRFAIKAGLESFIEGNTKIAKLKSGKYLMTMAGGGILTDKSKMSGEYRILLGGYETTVGTEGEDFGLKEVQKAWYASYPDFEKISDFVADDDRKVIVPVFKQKPTKDVKEGLIYIFGDRPFTFENESLEAVAKKNYAEYEGNYHIVQYGEGEYFLVPCIKTGIPAKKETMYPTKDVSLSFVFSRIPLSPEMFDGKEEITEKELLTYITEDFPEYGNGRSSIEYDKKNKLIIVSIKSSKKGAGFATHYEASMENLDETVAKAKTDLQNEDKDFALYFVETSESRIRLEKNAIGNFIGGNGNYDEFHMNLPKIPKSIMEEIYSFFRAVKDTMPRNNEAAAQIYWDKVKKEYFVYIPDQRVDEISVDYRTPSGLEHDENMVLVMDVHSHGLIRPNFSQKDDREEKGTRLFCVFGDFVDTAEYHFTMRAGNGGNFIPVADEDVFEDFYNGMPIPKKVRKPSRKEKKRLRELIEDRVSLKGIFITRTDGTNIFIY